MSDWISSTQLEIEDAYAAPYHSVATPSVQEKQHLPCEPIDDDFHPIIQHINIDANEFDRATEIRFCSLKRPHMRLFHMSWFSALFGFLGWYSIPPLMPVIRNALMLTDTQVLNSDIASTASTIITRIAVGPLLDKFGPRNVQTVLLWLGAIPIASAAFVSSATDLIIVRFCIGFIGCIFVSNQYWTTISFARNVVGTANAIVGGFSVAGIGLAFLILPYINIALKSSSLISEDLAWRLTIALPALLLVIMGFLAQYGSDASPLGNWKSYLEAKRKEAQGSSKVGLLQAYKICLSDPNTLILFAHYAVCFGCELQLNNMGALYFYEEFLNSSCLEDIRVNDVESCHRLSKTQAATIASLFGLMNLFSRGSGGILSDKINSRFGMKGRLWTQAALILCQSCFVLLLSRTSKLGVCILLYILIAIFAQASGGSTYSIVPYLSDAFTGVVAGLIGAGGNLGGVIFGFLFRSVQDRQTGLLYMSFIIAASSVLTAGLSFKSKLPPSAATGMGRTSI
uniref:Major Facilitator Superfamily (MFS) putative n=1 Tax=Albugo laibachii Nc14 TaxID=890382 RepID=F0WST4_9STRA|nr:Major Facilitator Superfamily (MFS) putative [Albugo laibachii Nc14]|eukprot:CCA24412.1 Major Facilitator Superfamily (MFS) putative [Albugo laibachii Nc14]